MDRALRARVAAASDGSSGQLRGEIQHYAYRDIADHLETIDRYTTLAARQMHEDGRRAGLLQLAGHPPLAFLRNYIARGGIRDGVPGFIISSMNAYYVFLKFAKLWELADREPEPEPEPGTNPEPGTRTPNPIMFSLHVDTARTWRGGQNQVLLTVNGLRSIGQRAALVAHPDGELRRRAAEGLDLIPIAPRTEMDLSAAWKFSRVIKRLQPDVIHAHDPHGVAMAALALSIGAASAPGGRDAGAGRGAPRRLPSQGQFVLALEVPPGRLLHRRVRGDPADAGRRRRAGRSRR